MFIPCREIALQLVFVFYIHSTLNKAFIHLFIYSFIHLFIYSYSAGKEKNMLVFFLSFEMSRKVISIIKCLVNYLLGYFQKLQAPDVCIDTGGEFHIYESL